MGSGKSTFAHQLGEGLKREVIHLDKLFHKKGWERRYSKEQWIEKMNELVSHKQWIIDGNYQSTLPIRLSKADTVIYFQFSKWESILGACKRLFMSKGKPFDKDEGVNEKISWSLIKKIITYPYDETNTLLKQYGNEKAIYRITNRKEQATLLKELLAR